MPTYSSAFGFTNKTANAVTVAPTTLNVVSNYAVVDETSTQVVLDNKTCPLDQQELVTYNCRAVPVVNTKVSVRNPAKVTTGVQYTIQVEEVLRTTSAEDPGVVIDEPIVMSLLIRHPRSGNITPAIVSNVLQRLIGACQKSNGEFRWPDLMRSALEPKAD